MNVRLSDYRKLIGSYTQFLFFLLPSWYCMVNLPWINLHLIYFVTKFDEKRIETQIYINEVYDWYNTCFKLDLLRKENFEQNHSKNWKKICYYYDER